ncbi:RNA-directed DNA polymerase, eukaryota, reverse transcriptase [Salix suchowensis]|nr:RNA-directed DNA polymerase, eukaryota, reverse transcriptase [Salix suchowensis]
MHKARALNSFKFHWRCHKFPITHLCFADDLMLFCHGDRGSAGVLKDVMENFSRVSGLGINFNKSSLFTAGIDPVEQEAIVSRLGIQIKELPVTYLGMPLITTRLTKADCSPLIDQATRTFDNMKNPWHRVAGIVIASAVYHIWKERNNRMHNQIFKSALSTRDDIINNRFWAVPRCVFGSGSLLMA